MTMIDKKKNIDYIFQKNGLIMSFIINCILVIENIYILKKYNIEKHISLARPVILVTLILVLGSIKIGVELKKYSSKKQFLFWLIFGIIESILIGVTLILSFVPQIYNSAIAPEIFVILFGSIFLIAVAAGVYVVFLILKGNFY